MTNEQMERLAAKLREEADELEERMETVSSQTTIQPHDVMAVAARTVGVMQGLAEAVEWYIEHEE